MMNEEGERSSESNPKPEEGIRIVDLPIDSLQLIFSHLPLRQILICRSVCKLFLQTLNSTSFLHPPLHLLALSRPSSSSSLHAFDPLHNQWLRFPLHFLPFRSTSPIAASSGLLYLWADSRTLVVCNPLTGRFRLLPQLGSAWSRHGTVLVGPAGEILILTDLAVLYLPHFSSTHWSKFSSCLVSKPRSPVLVSGTVFALCDVGSPWRSQWKLFRCGLSQFGHCGWERLDRHEWGDVFDILRRPRLIRGRGNEIFMAGGLKSSSLNSPCSTVILLRLDLDTLEWGPAGRMPQKMYGCFQESSKLKVFGGGNRVYFSGKRVGRLALWSCSEEGERGMGEWSWVAGLPGNGDGGCRGFAFDASLTAVP